MRRADFRNVPTGAPETLKPAGCRMALGGLILGNDSSVAGNVLRTNAMSSRESGPRVRARSATTHSRSRIASLTELPGICSKLRGRKPTREALVLASHMRYDGDTRTRRVRYEAQR